VLKHAMDGCKHSHAHKFTYDNTQTAHDHSHQTHVNIPCFATPRYAFHRYYGITAFQELQSIIISGESGAGKTEATKQCLQVREAAGV
jgi:myosin heavy subunit